MSLSFLWDYNISEAQYEEILSGIMTLDRLDQEWAAVRFLEYGTYAEIKKQ